MEGLVNVTGVDDGAGWYCTPKDEGDVGVRLMRIIALQL